MSKRRRRRFTLNPVQRCPTLSKVPRGQPRNPLQGYANLCKPMQGVLEKKIVYFYEKMAREKGHARPFKAARTECPALPYSACVGKSFCHTV
jgi:hypothetical protein